MKTQSSLPIRITIDDNQDFDAAQVIRVKDSLNRLLDSSPTIINVESGQSSKPSIYKIPHFMKEINSTVFEPKLVSFGPYHHGKQRLLPMEPEKLEAFRHFKTNYGLDIESIVKSVSSILEYLIGSYNKLEEKWTQDSDKFLQLMIVDGCFMLQFFKECPTSLKNMSEDITQDMLLLENQLPMKLLDELYVIANQDQSPSQDLKSLVCNSLGISPDGLTAEYSHILDMYKASLLHPPIDMDDRSRRKYNPSDLVCPVIPSATQLRKLGIKFEKSMTRSFTDVSFDIKRGVLKLPLLEVDDNTESIFLNVMAFEKVHVDAGSKITSFIILMDNLIDEDNDVALLASNKILISFLKNHKDATTLFSQLGNGVTIGLVDSHMASVLVMVNDHCSKAWNVWWATLKDPRTQKPWIIISIAAASFGFLLQIIQTVYGVYGYHRPTHS